MEITFASKKDEIEKAILAKNGLQEWPQHLSLMEGFTRIPLHPSFPMSDIVSPRYLMAVCVLSTQTAQVAFYVVNALIPDFIQK